MSGLTTWQTDDPCPRCGAHLTEISGPSSDRVIQQCRACAWSVTWAAPQLVLTAVQSDCLAAMAADAIAYRRAAATGLPALPSIPRRGLPGAFARPCADRVLPPARRRPDLGRR